MESKTETTRFKNAKVYYRIFPMMKMQWEHVKILEDMKTLYVRYIQDFGIGREGVVPSYWRFTTDGIFYNNSQLEMYNTVMTDIIDKVIDGASAIILNFGQSGTGKSLTASGLQNCYKDRGIAPRVISDLFIKKDVLKSEKDICFQMSYVETKKMCLKDLLKDDDKIIRSFRQITLKKVKSENDALSLLFRAESKREYSEDSITSHGANGVFTITIITKPANATDPLKKTSKLHIVDLGGIDSYGNVTSINKDVTQVSNANTAKTQLEQFILVLIQNRPDCIFVKQRLNVLIQYLGDTLNTHSILRCIGHIRADLPNLYITLSLLNFGQCIRGLKPKRLQPNITKSEDVEIKLLKNQIIEMRKENDLNEMLSSKDLASNITQDRVLQMQRVAQEYLENSTDDLVVLNVSDASTVLKVFKDLYNKLEIEKEESSKVAYEQGYQEGFSMGVNTEISRKGSNKSKNSIGTGKVKPSQSSLSTKASPRKSPSITSKAKSLDKANLSSKRSKMGSMIMKKSSTGKGQSNNGSVNESSSPLKELSEASDLPDNVPSQAEAWESFINDNTYDYAKLERSRKSSEFAAKELQLEYLDAIKKMQKCFELVGIRRNELYQAEMQRLFGQQVYNDSGKVIPSETETLCVQNCKNAQNELLLQQEFVLKKQAELTLALKDTQSIVKDIDNQFEEFCQKRYQISVPNLNGSSYTEVVCESGIVAAVEAPEPTISATELRRIQFYNELQRLMKEQILTEAKFKKKNKRWN